MKIKHLIMVGLILAILTIGAVSASDDADALAAIDNDDSVDETVSIDSGEGDTLSDEDDVDVSLNTDYEGGIPLDEDYAFAEITAPKDATGNVTVFVNDKDNKVFEDKLTNLDYVEDEDDSDFYIYSLKLGKLGNLAEMFTVGCSYWFEVNYSGDNYYLDDSDCDTLFITDTAPKFDFAVPEFVLTGDDEAKFYFDLVSDLKNNYSIFLDNNMIYTGKEKYYSEYFTNLADLNPGKHTLKVNYTGDDCYESFEDVRNFIYDDVILYVPDRVIANSYEADETSIWIFLPSSNGNITVLIDDKKFLDGDVEDYLDDYYYDYRIVMDLSDEDLEFTQHTYNITYCNGDYNKSVNGSFLFDFDFDVECEDYEMVDYIEFGKSTEFTVDLSCYAEGTVSVVVANRTLTFEVDYMYDSFFIDNLPIGEYNLTFTLTGNFPEKSCNYSICVEPVIYVPEKFTYNGNETISLTLPGNASGNLTVYEYDGDDNKVTIKTVPLKDGKAEISLCDLPLGSHYIYAEYTGEDYDVETVNEYIRVIPSVDYPEYVWKKGNYTITVSSPDNVKGNLTVYIILGGYEDEEHVYHEEKLVLYNGSASGTVPIDLPMDKLNKTVYYFTVLYSEDEYIVTSEEYWFRIFENSPDSNVTIEFAKELNKFGDVDYAYIITNLPRDGEGFEYEVYVDGKLVAGKDIYFDDQYSTAISGDIDMENLTLGTHNWKINATFYRYYNPISQEGTFTVTWIDVPEAIYGDEEIEFDIDDVNATGTLSLLIDGKDYAMEFVDHGEAAIIVKDLSIGEHTYEITYSGDKTHEKLTKSGKFTFAQLLYIANLEDDNVMPLYSFYPFFIIVSDDATGNVTATIGGQTVTAAIIEGEATVNFTGLGEGNYTITVKYPGDSKYHADEISYDFTIKGYMIVRDGDDDSTFFALVLPSDATGNLSAYLGSYDQYTESYDYDLLKTVALVNGTAIINVNDLGLSYGEYHVKVAYEGNYTEIEPLYTDIELSPKIIVSSLVAMGEDARVEIDVGSATGNITIILNNEPYKTVALKDGKINESISAADLIQDNFVSFKYIGDDLDEHIFDVYDGDGGYEPILYEIGVEINNLTIPQTFSSDGSGNITMDLPEGFSGNVSVYVDGEKVSTTPVTGGKVTVPVTGLNGTAQIRVEVEDANGTKYTASATVKVSKPDASVDIATPTDSKTPQFTVNLPKNATGSIIVNIGGKNYAADLINGSATINPTDLADGTYNATIRYTGDDNYDSFTKTVSVNIKTVVDPKITAGDLSVIYSAGTKYSVTIYGTDGKVAANTQVTFLVNGKVFKTVTTNANGVATVVITQTPGTYKITTKALGIEVTKKITVKHVLKLQKVKVKRSAKKLVIKATLSKVNGKYLKGKKITLKFKGKKYTAKTNKKGVAKFTIKSKVLKKLKKGKKVKYQATYLKDTVKYTVKVKK